MDTAPIQAKGTISIKLISEMGVTLLQCTMHWGPGHMMGTGQRCCHNMASAGQRHHHKGGRMRGMWVLVAAA